MALGSSNPVCRGSCGGGGALLARPRAATADCPTPQAQAREDPAALNRCGCLYCSACFSAQVKKAKWHALRVADRLAVA
eukprot:5881783-Pyramimonas_sp.AAC.1